MKTDYHDHDHDENDDDDKLFCRRPAKWSLKTDYYIDHDDHDHDENDDDDKDDFVGSLPNGA